MADATAAAVADAPPPPPPPAAMPADDAAAAASPDDPAPSQAVEDVTTAMRALMAETRECVFLSAWDCVVEK
jgi:hypothetical protein